jgi:hypothetical protein
VIVGYDVEFMQVPLPPGATFPIAAAQAEALVRLVTTIADPVAVRDAVLNVRGCRPGPGEAIDFVGRGLSYARFFILKDRIRVENNCSPSELIKVYDQLTELMPGLVILDLQSRQLHDAASFAAWWAKPL